MAELLTVDTVVPSVFVLGQYGVSGASQAAALTTILESLLLIGVFTSVEQAYKLGVAVGTFVVIDDPETPEQEFSVQVVRATSLEA